MFAGESVVDELAQRLGIDPLEFRLRNAVAEGDRRPDGRPLPSIGAIETLQAAAAHPHYRAPLGSGRGTRRGAAWRRACGSTGADSRARRQP